MEGETEEKRECERSVEVEEGEKEGTEEIGDRGLEVRKTDVNLWE